jgi:hypothetical protein
MSKKIHRKRTDEWSALFVLQVNTKIYKRFIFHRLLRFLRSTLYYDFFFGLMKQSRNFENGKNQRP